MRTMSLILVMLAAGCSSPLFRGASSDAKISDEAVRTYAKAHGLSRDEARQELNLYRDADYLRDLRQSQQQQQESTDLDAAPPLDNDVSTPR